MAGTVVLSGVSHATAPVPIPASPIWAFTASPQPAGTLTGTAAALPPIVCNLKVNNAHGSGHVGGTVNVVATLGCVPDAATLRLQVTLYKIVCDPNCNDDPYGSTGTNSNGGQPSISANSAAACTSGSYFGVAFGSIVAPPGYLPASGNVEGSGPTSKVTC
jgi:hypothetical protein